MMPPLHTASRINRKVSRRKNVLPHPFGDGRGRNFRVDLTDNVFQCFDAKCASHGDVIDLWAALSHLSVRDAALDLARTFDLEPAPPRGTEKRNVRPFRDGIVVGCECPAARRGF